MNHANHQRDLDAQHSGSAIAHVVLVLLLSFLLTGCVPIGGYVRDAKTQILENRALRTDRFQISLAQWVENVDKDTIIEFELQSPHRVWLQDGKQEVELGTLEYQFPDAPVKTMILDAGGDYLIIGWVDDSIDGYLDHVRVARPKSNFTGPWSKNYLTDRRLRVITFPLYSEELPWWYQIGSLTIYTFGGGDEEHSWTWHQQYDPPIDIREMAIPIKTNMISEE